MTHNAVIGTDELSNDNIIIDQLNWHFQTGDEIISFYEENKEVQNDCQNNSILYQNVKLNLQVM